LAPDQSLPLRKAIDPRIERAEESVADNCLFASANNCLIEFICKYNKIALVGRRIDYASRSSMLWCMLNSSGVAGSKMGELGGAIAHERTMGDDDVAHSTRWTHVEFARFFRRAGKFLTSMIFQELFNVRAEND
jgi:hypothetical protein